TAESDAWVPGIVAQPPFSMNDTCCDGLDAFSWVRRAATSACCRNLSTHIRANVETGCPEASCLAFASAVRCVTQPTHTNPMAASTAAPPAAPQRAGLRSEGACIGRALAAEAHPTWKQSEHRQGRKGKRQASISGRDVDFPNIASKTGNCHGE